MLWDIPSYIPTIGPSPNTEKVHRWATCVVQGTYFTTVAKRRARPPTTPSDVRTAQQNHIQKRTYAEIFSEMAFPFVLKNSVFNFTHTRYFLCDDIFFSKWMWNGNSQCLPMTFLVVLTCMSSSWLLGVVRHSKLSIDDITPSNLAYPFLMAYFDPPIMHFVTTSSQRSNFWIISFLTSYGGRITSGSKYASKIWPQRIEMFYAFIMTNWPMTTAKR